MSPPPSSPPQGDRDALLRYVERFALVLTETGLPRMAARVFAYVLADDAERYTASELSEGLGVSPAAISGAVRYLTQVGLVAREREPGARSDVYRVFDDDVWGTIFRRRLPLLDRYEQAAAEGVELLPADSPAGRRMRETREFFAFIRDEEEKLFERWDEHRRLRFGG